MTPPLYPDPGDADKPPPARASFSPVPDALLDLVRAGRLLRADAPLLHALMTHGRPQCDIVFPRQRVLADRLGCSVRTVQRGLDRLCAAGLVARAVRRDAHNRPLGVCYDLSALRALRPARLAATRMTPPASDPVLPTRHVCRPESESESVVTQADNMARPVVSSPNSRLVEALTRTGVSSVVAPSLVARHGAARCREALAALARRPNVRDRPAWLVACLQGGWEVGESQSSYPVQSSYPGSLRLATPPSEGGGCVTRGDRLLSGPGQAAEGGCHPSPSLRGKGGEPQASRDRSLASRDRSPDPLDALPPDRYEGLAGEARARLIAEMGENPVVRQSLEKGRSTALVRARMRQWLAGGEETQRQAGEQGGDGE